MPGQDLFARYLRQRAEWGERELFLQELTAAEALAAVSAAGRVDGGRGAPLEAAAAGASRRTGRARAAPVGSAPAVTGDPWAGGLEVLAAAAASCTLCRLHEGRRQVVFGEGNAAAELVVVGEAPGFEEDRTGRPFVGPAGKLLDLLLLSIALPRRQVYICNVIKCRPPNNRNPLLDEVACCSRYLFRQIELISPRVLLAVGNFAARTLLSTEESVGRLRGQIHSFRGTPAIATYHPAFLLRSPRWTRAAWQDFQMVRQVLDERA
ncbi:MAG: uracil-DNA glycosylase [Gemmatimonadetes bacterium]|nr:uracil-DNA glycosylase [Gemmatimonadota bacterium]